MDWFVFSGWWGGSVGIGGGLVPVGTSCGVVGGVGCWSLVGVWSLRVVASLVRFGVVCVSLCGREFSMRLFRWPVSVAGWLLVGSGGLLLLFLLMIP